MKHRFHEMALNRYMHPRNIYREPPSFKDLALKYPDLRKHMVQGLDGKIRLDFKNPEALRALTTTLLLNDFGLKVTIPSDRLVPTMPLRLNYILWLEDLLSTLPANLSNCSTSKVLGLDIGTGATCIYPLLGSRKNGWHFLAVDCDSEALDIARQNVFANQLQDKITMIKTTTDSILSRTVLEANSPIDFCMCNPPFFRDEVEANSLMKGRRASRPPPHAANQARPNEAITEGGESAFVNKMIEESEQLGSRIRIYTTMFGKKSSVAKAVERIGKAVGKANGAWATTEFCQGRTMRWGLAWTYLPDVRIDSVNSAVKLERKLTKLEKKSHSRPTAGFTVPTQIECCSYNLLDIQEKVKEILAEAQIKVKTTESSSVLQFMANSNTWSYQRRKRRAIEQVNSAKRMKEVNGKCEVTKATEDRLEIPSTRLDVQPAIEGLLFLERLPTGDVDLKIQWIGGSLGKDAANQILQFLKNKLL